MCKKKRPTNLCKCTGQLSSLTIIPQLNSHPTVKSFMQLCFNLPYQIKMSPSQSSNVIIGESQHGLPLWVVHDIPSILTARYTVILFVWLRLHWF